MDNKSEVELVRLIEVLRDISDAIEDALEDDAQPEDIAEAKELAAGFLHYYQSLLVQLDQEQKQHIEQYMALKVQLMQCQLAHLPH